MLAEAGGRPTRRRRGSDMHEALEAVLAKFRPGFQADGADARLATVDPTGVVEVQIVVGPETCMECLLPDDMLGQMLTHEMRIVDPTVLRVDVRRVERSATV